MPISVQCSCGHPYFIHARYAGTRRKCLYCGNEFEVPAGEPSMDAPEAPVEADALPVDAFAANPFGTPEADIPPGLPPPENPYRYRPSAPAVERRPEWGRRYLFLALALIPLILSSFTRDNFDLKKRFMESVEALSDEDRERLLPIWKQVAADNGSEKDLINALPNHKLRGALLPVYSWVHWLYAFGSATLFLLAIILLMPSNATTPTWLSVTAIFTGTIGIVLLLAAQWLAFHMPLINGGGAIGLILLILRGIGWAYALAMDPQYGFVLSLLGFTFGVGLCEELCKQIPVVHHFTTVGKKMDWRGACLWGLASGIGFGVSEGITYSSDMYNGLMGGNIYLIRFVSCVALHAIWAGAAGICVWKRQQELHSADTYWEGFFKLIWIVFPMMLMHGLYDTLLKFEYNIGAMATALVSIAYFAYVVENAKQAERDLEPHVRTA